MQVLGWFLSKTFTHTLHPTTHTRNPQLREPQHRNLHNRHRHSQLFSPPTDRHHPHKENPPHHTIPNKQNHNRTPSPHTIDRTNPQSQPLNPHNGYTNQRAPQTPSTHPRRTRRVEDATCKPLIDLKRRNSPIAGRLQRRCEWVPRCRFSWQSASSPIWGAFLPAGFLLRGGVHKGSGVWNRPVRTAPHPA